MIREPPQISNIDFDDGSAKLSAKTTYLLVLFQGILYKGDELRLWRPPFLASFPELI